MEVGVLRATPQACRDGALALLSHLASLRYTLTPHMHTPVTAKEAAASSGNFHLTPQTSEGSARGSHLPWVSGGMPLSGEGA